MKSIWTALTLTVTLVAGASAQPTESAEAEDTKPATATFFGDTGLWFAPTAEVLAHGRWSVSGYRRGTNFVQGFANVSDVAGTFAVGVRDRVELFGSFLFITRVDRDLRPIFINDPDVGGVLNDYPQIDSGWTGNKVGDLFLGAKVSLLSEASGQGAALALRGMVKAPTGDADGGASSGGTDFSVDMIVSKEMNRKAELTGYAGYEFRGQPDGFELPTGAFKWGAGAGFPSRGSLRATLEVNGILPSSDTVTLAGATLVGSDGSLPPLASTAHSLTRATVALNWQASNGFFIGAGYTWDIPRDDRDAFVTDEDGFSDYGDLQVRLGFYPGRRRPAPAPAPEPPAAPAAPAAPPPAAPAAPAAAAPVTPAPAPAAAPVPQSLAFEDVHFDFDRYTLRPDATRLLDDAVSALAKYPTLNLLIEGHTCNIGTAEYNLALGDRRASAVRAYLISRGVAAGRLTTISYGEERPRHDNTREETRRLNRRAALVVRLQ